MKEELITYETAVLAKEKGFNEPCMDYCWSDKTLIQSAIGSCTNGIPFKQEQFKDISRKKRVYTICIPTQSLLQRWLREEHKITLVIYPSLRNGKVVQWEFDIYTDLADAYYESDINSNTYELALEQGLIEALNLIEI